jgi:hypothetical protein
MDFTRTQAEHMIKQYEKRVAELREDYVTARTLQQSGRMRFIVKLGKMHKAKILELQNKYAK